MENGAFVCKALSSWAERDTGPQARCFRAAKVQLTPSRQSEHYLPGDDRPAWSGDPRQRGPAGAGRH
jgi:hypothetical protein